MKFWLSAIGMAAAVTIGSTALSFLNPAAKRAKPAAAAADQPTGPQPRIAVTGNFSAKHERVPQHTKGLDQFEVKNVGEAPLKLSAGKTNCTCTDLYFSKAPTKVEDTPPADGKDRFIEIPPGGSAYAVARWDTRDKAGANTVSGVVHTNDPITPGVIIQIELDIVQELVVSHDLLSLGSFDQGKPASAAVDCVAPVAKSVDIKDVKITASYLSAKVEALAPAELERLAGKSGQRIVVTASADTPTGKFQENLTFKASVNGRDLERTVAVQGIVAGDIQIVGDAKIDFRVGDAKSGKKEIRMLRAAKAPAGGTLKIGEVVPDNRLAAALVPKAPMIWSLEVKIKPDAPPGAIPRGKITVVDGAGKQVAAFVVVGVVNN